MDDVLLAGKNASVSLYGGVHGDTVDRFSTKDTVKLATKSSQIHPQNFFSFYFNTLTLITLPLAYLQCIALNKQYIYIYIYNYLLVHDIVHASTVIDIDIFILFISSELVANFLTLTQSASCLKIYKCFTSLVHF